MAKLNLNSIHKDWLALVTHALADMDHDYLQTVETHTDWLPGAEKIFNAFSIPLMDTRYILFGESPYPRQASAIGYAFWDGAVTSLWSNTGLSKAVNRATSLRNIIKMLLIARGDLKVEDTSQNAIVTINKASLVQTGPQLFNNFLQHGFLLLNASLVLSTNGLHQDASAWRVFIAALLKELYLAKPDIVLVLLGRVAKEIDALPATQGFRRFHAEHPYNLSFVTNPSVIEFFKPFDLLRLTHE